MIALNEDKLFKLSFEYASCGKTIIDLEGNIIKVNQSFCELLGYDEMDMLQKNSSFFTPKACCNVEKEHIKRLINNEAVNVRYNTKRTTKEGRELDVNINAIAIHNGEKDGFPIYILKQIEKISTRDDLEAEIKRKEFYLNKIMSEMPAHIYFKDLKSRFILVNRSMLNLFGVSNLNELVGKTDYDFFAQEHANQAYKDEQEIIQTGKEIVQVEKEVWPNGRVTWVHTTKKPLYDDSGSLIGTFGISKDITESKKAEKALLEAHKELEQKNKELQITLKNLKETQSQLINSEKLAALGQLISGIAHEVNTPLGAINASNSNITSSFAYLIENFENGIAKFTPKELSLLKKIIKDYKLPENNFLGSREKRAIKREISERLSGDGISDSNTIADILVYVNQHENCDAILRYSKEMGLLKVLKTAKSMVSMIKNSDNIAIATEKASQVVLALKKYIHKTPDGNKSKTDLIDNIETVLTLNHNKIKQGIEVVKNYDKVPLIEVFPDELSQVWNNLVTNAIHAMNNSGTLTLTVKDAKEAVFVSIEDTGCGIPIDIRDKIFAPFYTTKASGEGTGLGLDIVKRIVEKHDGELLLESEINKGTTFTITLPKL